MMVHMCKRIISPVFFHISQIFIFWVISGVKELKLSRMTKTLCLLHSISQEAYILWSWVFGIHVLNDDISRFFFFSSKGWFSRLFCPTHSIFGTIHHMFVVFGTYVWNGDFSSNFLYIFKILIFRIFKGCWQKVTQSYQCRSVSLSFPGT